MTEEPTVLQKALRAVESAVSDPADGRPKVTSQYSPVVRSPGDLLNQRQKTHGEFTSNALLSQSIKDIMHESPNWKTLSPVQKETLDLIATKISRALSGNANEPDHWADIAGYALLAKERLG